MENAQLSSPESDKTPEQIQSEMCQTREALTEKVGALEHQVLGSVQSAADTLSSTVDSVKSIMASAPGVVARSVRQATSAVKKSLDVSGKVRDNPWSALGVSAGIGFLAGWLVSGGRTSAAVLAATPMPSTAYAPPATTASAQPGIFDDLVSMLGRKVREVAETAIDSASSALNKNVRAEVPKLVDAAAEMAGANLAPDTTSSNRFSRLGGFPS